MLGAIWWANDERGFPVAFLLVIVLLVFWTWVAERTTFGRHVYAVGGNAEAARRAGINVRRIRIHVFMISGAMAGLGGVIFASRLSSVDLNAGGGTILLDAIAAAVIGGTSLFGGRGRVISALLGSLVIATVANGIDLLGLQLGDQVHGHGRDPARRRDARHGLAPPARAGRPVAMKTSLGIWALGPMVTRFVPGGYQPQHRGETTAEKVARAVAGLGELIDDYEFHYPQELSPENVDEVREALDGHGIYTIARGLHLESAVRQGRALVARRRRARRGARRGARAADFAGSVGAQLVLWPGIEGYNYPFQTPYADSWARFVDGVGEVAARCHEGGIPLFLEHKNSEPAMKILMRNIGMTLHVIHTLRDAGDHERPGEHGLAAPDHERRVARRVRGDARRRGPARPSARELRLGHVRRRQHGRRDRVHGDRSSSRVELRRARYGENGERLGFDLYPYTEDAVAAVERSVKQWNFIWDVSGRIDDAALREAQSGARTRCAPTSSSTPRSAPSE